jgi:hypothetical protein
VLESNRFLLIKAWGCGFWSDVSHVAGQLLIAELTDRIPVIFWGTGSLYASENPLVKDAFIMYFLPVSNYSVYDSSRQVSVIRVEPANNFTICHLNPFVNRMSLTAVRF